MHYIQNNHNNDILLLKKSQVLIHFSKDAQKQMKNSKNINNNSNNRKIYCQRNIFQNKTNVFAHKSQINQNNKDHFEKIKFGSHLNQMTALSISKKLNQNKILSGGLKTINQIKSEKLPSLKKRSFYSYHQQRQKNAQKQRYSQRNQISKSIQTFKTKSYAINNPQQNSNTIKNLISIQQPQLFINPIRRKFMSPKIIPIIVNKQKTLANSNSISMSNQKKKSLKARQRPKTAFQFTFGSINLSNC